VRSVKKFRGKVPEEIISTCCIPKGIIPLLQEDIFLMACGMQSYKYFEIEGYGIDQIRQRLCEELNAITLMPRNNLTIESVGFVLRCNSDLLWSEFHEIKSKFEGLCKHCNMQFNYGVVEGKESTKNIFLSAFYFIGENKVNSDNTSFDFDEKFLAQVKEINKILH